MNVLITGASGFVGSALCEQIVFHHPEIRKVFAVSRKLQQEQSSSPDRIEFLHSESLAALASSKEKLQGIDCIIHLAARVHQMKDLAEDPLTQFRLVNTQGTYRLAELAARLGVRRFIYLSSIKVNGEGGDVVYSEDSDVSPKDPYGISKWEAEQQLLQLASHTSLEVIIIRSPLVYGPGVRANFLKMLRFVSKGIPLPIGAIHNQRSLIYVGNLVDAIITTVIHPDAANQTFLISDGQDVSTPQLVRLMAKSLGCSARLISIPRLFLLLFGKVLGRSKEIERLTGSLTVNSQKLRNTLDWEPPFTLEEGVEATAEWFQSNSAKNLA